MGAYGYYNAEEVALLAEGVDRNRLVYADGTVEIVSPSSRRAWIEITMPQPKIYAAVSPSSRRAWIEI